MYGLINKAISSLVIETYGQKKWDKIKSLSEIDDVFVSMETYDDDVTRRVALAASSVLGLSPDEFLEKFGRYWLIFIKKEGYGEMLSCFGDDFTTFIQRLNSMHGRIQRVYPKMRPPHFLSTSDNKKTTSLYYRSSRPGFAPMVVGLLRGLALHFGVDVTIVNMGQQEDGSIKFVVTEGAETSET